MDQGKLPVGSFDILLTNTVTITRSAGSLSAQANITAPQGANLFIATGTLTNVSPLLTFPVQYLAPNGTGGVLWGVRGYYDATVGSIRIFNESYDPSITASTYIVAVKYYLLNVPVK